MMMEKLYKMVERCLKRFPDSESQFTIVTVDSFNINFRYKAVAT